MAIWSKSAIRTTQVCGLTRVDLANTPHGGPSHIRPGITAGLQRWGRHLGVALMLGLTTAVLAQPGVDLQALAPGVWWVPGAAGDANEHNRGAISNLLVVADGQHTWALGSGPSPAYGRALAQTVARVTGRSITDVIAPWSRPELVLGSSGLPQVRVWSHQEVRQQMHERCTRCVERLAARLGNSSRDLGPHPVRLADHQIAGSSGRLGPWQWWRLDRSTSTSGEHTTPQVVTVWWLASARLWAAPGLIWTDGAPDLRDSSVADLIKATTSLQALQDEVTTTMSHASNSSNPAAASSPWATRTPTTLHPPDTQATRWLPEQGPLAPPDVVARHLHYWTSLQAAAAQAWQVGASENDAIPSLAGVDPAWLASPRHALNWQRAWREAEASALAAPAPHPIARPPSAPP